MPHLWRYFMYDRHHEALMVKATDRETRREVHALAYIKGPEATLLFNYLDGLDDDKVQAKLRELAP